MTASRRLLAYVLVSAAALAGSACVEEGIGMGVPSGGARWSGAGSGPDILVAGGPVYR